MPNGTQESAIVFFSDEPCHQMDARLFNAYYSLL